MIKKTVEFELKYQEAAKNADELGKIVQKQDKEIAKLQGTIDKNFDDIAKSSKSTAKGVKGIGNALKAAGIGLAIAAFAKLTEVFNQNQKVTDAFNTTFEVLSLAFNDFFNFLDANVGTVIDYFKGIFENPVQSISNFGSAIYDGIVKRLEQGLEALGLFGKAAIKFFAGDFAGAAMTAKEASKELFDIVTGEDGGFEKITESVKTTVASITNYAKSTVEAARATVDLNKQAEIAAVINQGLIEKYDRQAEQQRQLRDDETKTIEERIAANNKLGEVLEEQQKLMLENVDITIRAAQAEYNKNKNQENYIALLEAQNEREAVLAQIEGFRSEQIINRISLEKELGDLKDEQAEKDKERAEAEIQLAKDVQAAKKQSAMQGLALIGEIAGEGSKVAKAAAIAQATVSGVQSTIEAFKTAAASPITILFPAYPIVQAGIAAGFAATNIAKIKSTSMSGGGGGSIGGGGSAAPQAPSFNVVGAAPENQLAQTLGEREDKPMKAYVVSNEVTNAQALDRNIIEGASIG
jgi:hypothetical protein